MRYRATVDEDVYLCELDSQDRTYRIRIGDRQFGVDAVQLDSAERLSLLIDGKSYEFDLELVEGMVQCRDEHGTLPVSVRSGWHTPSPTRASEAEPSAGVTTLRAEIPGVVAELRVEVGASTEPAETLLVLEAMKMLNSMRLPQRAVVTAIHVSVGQTVKKGDALMDIR